MARVKFNTKPLSEKIQRAAIQAVDETTEAAARSARGTRMNLPPHTAAGHPWYGVTERVENEVRSQPARQEGGRIVGSFGATKRRGDYAFMLERMHPYLRPAAAREFPQLARRIGARL